jgi:hypothetical protein
MRNTRIRIRSGLRPRPRRTEKHEKWPSDRPVLQIIRIKYSEAVSPLL